VIDDYLWLREILKNLIYAGIALIIIYVITGGLSIVLTKTAVDYMAKFGVR